VIATSGVVNAASFSAVVAPGTFATIFGNGLAATTRTWTSADFVNGNLPVLLDGVSVKINGKAAYPYYVSPSQIDVIAPADSTSGSVPVVVTNNGVAGATSTVQLQAAAPAFFSVGKYVIATHANGSLVGPASVLPGATPAIPNQCDGSGSSPWFHWHYRCPDPCDGRDIQHSDWGVVARAVRELSRGRPAVPPVGLTILVALVDLRRRPLKRWGRRGFRAPQGIR
jgi:hypothetical protein